MSDDSAKSVNNFDLDDMVNGKWNASYVLPEHETEQSTFKEISNQVKEKLKDVLQYPEKAHKEDGEGVSTITNEHRLLHDLFSAHMNRDISKDRVEVAPISSLVQSIDDAHKADGMGGMIGLLETMLINPFFSVCSNEDPRNTANVRFTLCFPSLTLADRIYYLDDSYSDKVNAFEKNVDEVLRIFDGLTNNIHSLSQISGHDVVEVEHKMAKAIKTVEQRRDMDSLYSRLPIMSFVDSVSLCGLDIQDSTQNKEIDCSAIQAIWNKYFDKSVVHPDIMSEMKNPGIVPQEIVVYDTAYFQKLSKILITTPFETLRSYVAYKAIVHLGSLSMVSLDDTLYRFYELALTGQKRKTPLDDRVYNYIDALLGEALGRVYVDNFFDSRTKGEVEKMIQMIREEMRKSIGENSWMSGPTKEAAYRKLQHMTVKVGYPDVPVDRSVMHDGIRARLNDLTKHGLTSVHIFARKCYYIQDVLAKIDTPRDLTKWSMNPHDVNAYYDPQMNEIVFPAGILNDPIYDLTRSVAKNYGALGTTIGHEITHGFDDQGRKYDHAGNINNWWTTGDLERFNAYGKRMIDQYDKYCVVIDMDPDESDKTGNEKNEMKVNGILTLGENIADLGGVNLALRALMLITQSEQDIKDFFLSYARLWQRKLTRDKTITRILSDPHSPAKYRVWVVRNIDKFYEVFPEAINSQMYLKDRIYMF